MELDSVVVQLREASKQQELVKEAYASCKRSLYNYEREEQERGAPLHYSVDDLELHFNKQSLTFEHDILKYSYMNTEIGLYMRHDGFGLRPGLHEFGRYHLITRLDGQAIDDYLIVDEIGEANQTGHVKSE